MRIKQIKIWHVKSAGTLALEIEAWFRYPPRNPAKDRRAFFTGARPDYALLEDYIHDWAIQSEVDLGVTSIAVGQVYDYSLMVSFHDEEAMALALLTFHEGKVIEVDEESKKVTAG